MAIRVDLASDKPRHWADAENGFGEYDWIPHKEDLIEVHFIAENATTPSHDRNKLAYVKLNSSHLPMSPRTLLKAEMNPWVGMLEPIDQIPDRYSLSLEKTNAEIWNQWQWQNLKDIDIPQLARKSKSNSAYVRRGLKNLNETNPIQSSLESYHGETFLDCKNPPPSSKICLENTFFASWYFTRRYNRLFNDRIFCAPVSFQNSVLFSMPSNSSFLKDVSFENTVIYLSRSRRFIIDCSKNIFCENVNYTDTIIIGYGNFTETIFENLPDPLPKKIKAQIYSGTRENSTWKIKEGLYNSGVSLENLLDRIFGFYFKSVKRQILLTIFFAIIYASLFGHLH